MVKKKGVKKEENVESSQSSNSKIKINYWMVASVILAVLLLISGIVSLTSGISKETAEKKFTEFAQSQGADVNVSSVKSVGDLYEITFNFQGQEGKFHISKDGKYIGQMMEVEPQEEDLSGNAVPDVPTNAPKSNRPQVELYVWSYCPYGVQAQGPMSEVANLLGSSADFKIVPYYDGHGAYETQQNQIQSCIQKLEPTKYWDYSAGFVANIYSKCGATRDIECDKTESVKLMKSLGIDSDDVLACVKSEGTALNSAASQKAQASGVTGSPTIKINGVMVNAARNAEAIKTAVCSAYNNAPAECGEVLDSSAAAAAGNC